MGTGVVKCRFTVTAMQMVDLNDSRKLATPTRFHLMSYQIDVPAPVHSFQSSGF